MTTDRPERPDDGSHREHPSAQRREPTEREKLLERQARKAEAALRASREPRD